MENSDVADALEAAERSFERTPDNVETGLDVDDAELVQLRRACRLLAASRLLETGVPAPTSTPRPVPPSSPRHARPSRPRTKPITAMTAQVR